MKVENIMHRNLLAIEEDETVKKFINLCDRHNISEMPVIDKYYRVIGYINETFIVKAALPAYLEYINGTAFLPVSIDIRANIEKVLDEPIVKFMKKEKFKIKGTDSVIYAADMLVKNNLRIVPVVDDEDKLVGILRRVDIFKEVIDKKWN